MSRVELVFGGQDRGVQLGPLTVVEVVRTVVTDHRGATASATRRVRVCR